MKNKESEDLRITQKYAYEIGLLLKGMSVKNVKILSENVGNDLSLRTLHRLKKEYV